MRISLDISPALLACALIAILGLVACASTPEEEDIIEPEDVMPEEFAGAPSWVIEGCNALGDEDRGKLICGIGSMGGSSNTSLKRTTAQARGRTEIARTLEVQVKAMIKDYQATTTGGEEFGTAASDEQHVIDVSKQITDFSLSGTELKDTWISNSGTFNVLMVLDVERFKDSIGEMKELSASVREAVQQRAEANWGELDEEVERERNR